MVCVVCVFGGAAKPSDDEGTYLLEELTLWIWVAVAKGSFTAKKRRKEET